MNSKYKLMLIAVCIFGLTLTLLSNRSRTFYVTFMGQSVKGQTINSYEIFSINGRLASHTIKNWESKILANTAVYGVTNCIINNFIELK